MAIKGLTNRGAAFAQIGNIRKGAKVTKNGIERPVDLKYFRVEFDDLEQERAAKFAQVYGSQPTEINILIPFDEIDRCWDAWCEAYTAGRMVARSDGEYFTYLVDLTSGSIVVQNGLDGSGSKVPHRTDIGIAGKSKIQCKPVGRLKVIVPELQSAAYLVLHTSSWHDIKNISEQLEGIKMLNGGRLVGIPLVLRRRPKKISIPKPDGTRARMEKWLISIEADPQWVAAMIGKLQHAALPVAVINPSLPEPAAKEEDEEISEAIFDEDDDEEYWNGIEESGDPDPEPPVLAEAAVELGGQVEPLRYEPEMLKARIQEIAALSPNAKMTNEKRGLVCACLEQALSASGDAKENRKQLLKWLVGKSSMTEIDDPTAAALYKWLEPTKDSGGAWSASLMATREAIAAFNAAQPKQDGLPF